MQIAMRRDRLIWTSLRVSLSPPELGHHGACAVGTSTEQPSLIAGHVTDEMTEPTSPEEPDHLSCTKSKRSICSLYRATPRLDGGESLTSEAGHQVLPQPLEARPEDAGNGFLLSQGYSLVWAGLAG
jgi:hypothetical protein